MVHDDALSMHGGACDVLLARGNVFDVLPMHDNTCNTLTNV